MHHTKVGSENVKDLGQKLCRQSEQELVLRRIFIYEAQCVLENPEIIFLENSDANLNVLFLNQAVDHSVVSRLS